MPSIPHCTSMQTDNTTSTSGQFVITVGGFHIQLIVNFDSTIKKRYVVMKTLESN